MFDPTVSVDRGVVEPVVTRGRSDCLAGGCTPSQTRSEWATASVNGPYVLFVVRGGWKGDETKRTVALFIIPSPLAPRSLEV